MNEPAWASVNLGDITSESRKRAGNDTALLERTVYGVDRSIGLNPIAKYTANSLERYKLIEQGMFAYNPMRLNIGSIGYCSQDVQPGLVSPDYVVFECNPNKLNPDFLNYYIDSSPWIEWTASAGVGSVRTRIYYKELARLPILLPTISEQLAIAEILGSLDNKIEANHRMNATLESMARAVFRQWFVEGDEVGDWDIGVISDLAIITSGKRPDARQKYPNNEFKYPLYGGGGIMAYANKSLYNFPILLTGRVGTLGLIFRITAPCWASDNTLITIPNKPEYYEFLYFQLEQTDLKVLNRGSTQPLLTQTDLQKCSCILPTNEILFKFHNIVSPMFAKIDANNEESRTLGSLRDSLLPKLMRGDVRVKDL